MKPVVERLLPLLLLLVASGPTIAGDNPAVEKLEAQILRDYRDAEMASIVDALGEPSRRVDREESATLTWTRETAEETTCEAVFDFSKSKLVAVEILTESRKGAGECRRLVRPLLAGPPPAEAQPVD